MFFLHALKQQTCLLVHFLSKKFRLKNNIHFPGKSCQKLNSPGMFYLDVYLQKKLVKIIFEDYCNMVYVTVLEKSARYFWLRAYLRERPVLRIAVVASGKHYKFFMPYLSNMQSESCNKVIVWYILWQAARGYTSRKKHEYFNYSSLVIFIRLSSKIFRTFTAFKIWFLYLKLIW